MMAEQLSIAQFRDELQRFGSEGPRMMKRLALAVIQDGTRQVLGNLNDDLVMRRTGTLMRYVGMALRAKLEQEGSITVGLPKGEKGAMIGRVQEEGATINAKNWFTKGGSGPWLVFPSAGGDQWTVSGVLKANARASYQGNRPVGVRLAMVKSVTLKPRYWWSGGWLYAAQRIPTYAKGIIDSMVKRGVE